LSQARLLVTNIARAARSQDATKPAKEHFNAQIV
jgi:hypothetical protein